MAGETSDYDYVTQAELENFMGGVTFANIDAEYDEAMTAMIITSAEEMVHSYIGVSGTAVGTVTDSIKLSTKVIAADLMQNIMFHKGQVGDKDVYKELRTEVIKELLAGDSDVGVDTIPMGGAERYYTAAYRGFY